MGRKTRLAGTDPLKAWLIGAVFRVCRCPLAAVAPAPAAIFPVFAPSAVWRRLLLVEEGFKLFRRKRSGKKKSLPIVAAHRYQIFSLFFGFDPFGSCREAGLFGQSDYGFGNTEVSVSTVFATDCHHGPNCPQQFRAQGHRKIRALTIGAPTANLM